MKGKGPFLQVADFFRGSRPPFPEAPKITLSSKIVDTPIESRGQKRQRIGRDLRQVPRLQLARLYA
jgi:hypothetical protein